MKHCNYNPHTLIALDEKKPVRILSSGWFIATTIFLGLFMLSRYWNLSVALRYWFLFFFLFSFLHFVRHVFRVMVEASIEVVLDDLPMFFRKLAYGKWQGRYYEFNGVHVGVFEGNRDTPSYVILADLQYALGVRPTETEFRRLKSAFGKAMFQSADPLAKKRWVVDDVSAVKYVETYARTVKHSDVGWRLSRWLTRSVFRQIDNRRSQATGRTYAFTGPGFTGETVSAQSNAA
jgi:hypothetical protein